MAFNMKNKTTGCWNVQYQIYTHYSHCCALATSTKVSSDFTTLLMHPWVTSPLVLKENLSDTFEKKKRCKKHTVQENVKFIFTETSCNFTL